MSNTNFDTDLIQIAKVDVFVDDQSEAEQSSTSIGTHALGPCMCFIIDCIFKTEQQCILHHYTFHKDEKTMSQVKIIRWLLNFIFDLLKDFLGINSMMDEFNEPYIKDIFVLVTGGDLNEGINIRQACFNIFNNLVDINDEDFVNNDLLYLYQQLKNRIIIIKPVLMIPESEEESDDDEVENTDDYPSLWINYCSQLKIASMGFFGHLKSQLQWKFQSTSIENFKRSCTPEELEQFNRALSFIPDDVVFELSESITESSISATTTETEIVLPTDEQESVMNTNTTVPPTSLSLGRVNNVSLKEVNKYEKEESAVIATDTENDLSKKKSELGHEDETKKIK
ncbi:unnamed protein product [Rotaria sordida]|uniref:Uncharacterized protein n=1 Tax=Rotaria sordida TaxID=392033 RepID=A0A815BMM1_9BILA|nr:unnamed protein product [Rotaria sordida]CAF1350585.1 unnamed protein product [Rotaria sordida]CAF3817218.1 unnamed protein product [Rotaria sordida]CAF3977954.1 unnamed protein product [Rotaria sordida]